MVANPNEVPPAFRGRQPSPSRYSFIGMQDDQVLRIAAGALRMVSALPVGSRPRAEQWDSFEQAMAELGARAVRQTLARIHEIHEQEASGELGDGGRPALDAGEQ